VVSQLPCYWAKLTEHLSIQLFSRNPVVVWVRLFNLTAYSVAVHLSNAGGTYQSDPHRRRSYVTCSWPVTCLGPRHRGDLSSPYGGRTPALPPVVPNYRTITKPAARGGYAGLSGEEGKENPVAFAVSVTCTIQHTDVDRVSYVQQWIHKKAPRSRKVGIVLALPS
jgi:hypothetical protein